MFSLLWSVIDRITIRVVRMSRSHDIDISFPVFAGRDDLLSYFLQEFKDGQFAYHTHTLWSEQPVHEQTGLKERLALLFYEFIFEKEGVGA